MALHLLDFPEATLAALEELADATGVEKGTDCIAQLIQDALRTYEWIIRRQLEGKTVIALTEKDLEILKDSPEIHGPRDFLDRFFTSREKIEAYFKKAA